MQALQKLDCSHNHITGGLEPLRGCTALTQLWATHNQLVGGLEPLEGCKALQGLCNWPPFEPVGIITVPICRSTDPVVRTVLCQIFATINCGAVSSRSR